MSYDNAWNETTPTPDTLANTIAGYFTDNMKAIRERLDDVFGTSDDTSIATADPYSISVIRMQGVTDSGVIGGANSWSVFDSTNTFKNLQVLDTADVIFRGNIIPAPLPAVGTLPVVPSTLKFRDSLNTVNTLTITDAGQVTILKGLELKGGSGIVDQVDAGTHSGALTVDLSLGNNQKVIASGGLLTITLSNGVAGGVYLIKLHYAGGGSVAFANLNWDSGDTPPVFTNTSGTSDIITIYFDGTNYYGVAAGLNFSV